jgi:lipoprotein NlpI/transglutaminase-like putative cysteine protease
MLKMLLAMVLACASTPALAQRTVQSEGFNYTIDKVPAWAQPAPAPAAPPWNGRSIVRYPLVDTQVNLSGAQPVRFQRTRVVAADPSGLALASELHIRFNPAYETIVLHEVGVSRGGGRTDRLPGLKIELLQRETQLERSVYDGVVTAFAVIHDVRVGDLVDFSYSVRGANPVFGGKFSDDYTLNYVYPTDVRRVRIEYPARRPLRHKVLGLAVAPAVTEKGGMSVVELLVSGLAPAVAEDRTPYWSRPFPELQVSEFTDWGEVKRWANEHFGARGKPAPEIVSLAERIRAESKTPEEMVGRVLAFAQEEIRYFAVETGTNSHKPSPAGETFSRRYGDCKDKAVLTVALLAQLGMDAQPALVSFYRRRQVSNMLPSPLAFDHVIVAANVGGRSFWLDPTRTNQGRALDKLGFEWFDKALIVDSGGEALVEVKEPPQYEDTLHVTERFAIRNYSAPVALTVVGRSRGTQAERVRAYLAARSADVVESELGDDIVRRYPGAKRVKPVQTSDDRQKNELTITEYYELPRFFSYAQGLVSAGFSGSAFANIVKAPDKVVRSSPMALPYLAHTVQRFEYELPLDMRFTLGQPVSISGPDLAFSYRSEKQGRVLAFEFGLRVARDHVTPADMPAHLERLAKIRQQLYRQIQLPAYDPERIQRDILVALKAKHAQVFNMPEWPRTFLLRSLGARMRSEAAIAAGLIEGKDLALARTEVGVELSHSGDRAKALEVLDQAIESDPQSAAAYRTRAEVLAHTGRFEPALGDIERANAIDPEGARPYSHAHVLYYLGRYQQAHDLLLADASRTIGAEQTYRMLWLYFAALNLKLDPGEVLRRSGYAGARSEWPGPILSYLLDEITEDKVYAAAREDTRESLPRLCETWYFVGQRRLMRGEQARAKEAFQNAVGTQVTPYIEYAYSDVELRRMR